MNVAHPAPVANNLRRGLDVEATVQTQLIDQPGLSIRRVHGVINPASGCVGPGAADELATLFAEFGLDHRVSELIPGQLEDTVRAAIDTGPDLMVVLGGDGTARLVAEMCGPRGPLVAPLPGGTMNKLGRALYGSKPWREALFDILTGGEERWMPSGEIGGRDFYCSAVLGSPALCAREAIRARELGRAWRQAVVAFRRAFMARLRYEFDGAEIGRGLAIGLICPTISRALGENEGPWKLPCSICATPRPASA
jgi:diacylglycerol kinase family enzyme